MNRAAILQKRHVAPILCALLSPALLPANLRAFDESRYMHVDELRPGMKGFGRTVLRGTEITTFEVEVLSVMRNVYYARQDVILVRCRGANLEHSGIIAGMSGSPVYITDEEGRNPRMIGAIAYGWSFNKDPIAGVQPIHQMLAVYASTTRPAGTQPAPRALSPRLRRPDPARMLGGLGRYAVLFDARDGRWGENPRDGSGGCIQPLSTPIMVSGMSMDTMAHLNGVLAETGLELVPSGGFGGGEASAEARLEPGSVLCVPLMRGDTIMDALGTCTEVIDGAVLGFGHSFFAEGPIELPMATGAVHGVIPSVMRSNKLGAPLRTVGRLVADQNAAICGRFGEPPAMIPCDITLRTPGGERRYRYEAAHHEYLTPLLLNAAIRESVTALCDLPREHTVRHTVEIEFEGLGTFRASNFSSQSGVSAVVSDAAMPASIMMDNELGKARVRRMKAEIDIEPAARTATIERAELVRDRVRPGDPLEVTIWWRPFRADPVARRYSLKLPEEIPEGGYELTVCTASSHLAALRSEKPYLFERKNMAQMLELLNRVASVRDDRVYLRLPLPTGGMSVGPEALPELPSFRRRILADAKRSDVGRYTETLVADYPVEFVFSGSRSFRVQVDKRADQ